MIAVVPRDAALVDVEPDATVRGYPGAEVRDADRDVIDARENSRAYSAWIFARCTISRMRFKPSCVHCVTIAGGEPIGSNP